MKVPFLRANLIGALIAAVGASAAVSTREFSSAPSLATPASEQRGPVAWVSKAGASGPKMAQTQRTAREVEDATAALALASMSAAELDELRAGLDLLGSRLEAQANPFGDDLEDGPPGEAMAAVRRSLAPALTAAHHLTARTQTSADGTFAITMGASCAEAPPDATCFPLWGSDGSAASAEAAKSELRERASFFAWPIASAAVVRFPDPKRAGEALDLVRERARAPESRMAMAVDERTVAGDTDPRATAVREAAKNVLARASDSSQLDMLRPLAGPAPSGRRVPWLTLAGTEIMVVPKLGGLSDLGAFARELQDVLSARGLDRDAQWVRRPGPPDASAHQR